MLEKKIANWKDMGYFMIDPIEYRFVDKVEVIPGKEAWGVKLLSTQDWYFKMKNPQNPTIPVGFILEALMQTGIFILTMMEQKYDPMMAFHSCTNLQVFDEARPGDILKTHVELKSFRRGIAKFNGKVKGSSDTTLLEANFVLVAQNEVSKMAPNAKE